MICLEILITCGIGVLVLEDNSAYENVWHPTSSKAEQSVYARTHSVEEDRARVLATPFSIR